MKKKLKSIKQVLTREANIHDAVNDIIRLNDVYGSSLSDALGGSLDKDHLNPLRPMDTVELVKNIGDMGRKKVTCPF